MKSARQRTGSEGAKALAQTLHNLGFPGKVSPSSLQWVFEDPQTKGVMEWLAAQDLSSLVLTPSERERYAELEANGLVLEGNELEEAFRKTLGGEVGLVVEEKPGTDPLDPRTSSSFRQEEQRFLEKDLELIDEEREALLAMRTVLRNQTAEVRKKKAAVQRMAGAAEKELAKARAQCSAASKLVDEQLEKIAKTANAIQDFYGPGKKNLLCTSPINDYVRADLECSKRLMEALQSKKAADGPEIDIDKPPSLYLNVLNRQDVERSDLLDTHEARQNELDRLRHAFETQEMNRIAMVAMEAYSQARRAEEESLASSNKLSDPDFATPERAAELEGRCRELQSQRDGLMKEIRGLVGQVSVESDIRILKEDYARKLARQERYLDEKRAILSLVLRQASWHKALDGGLAMEAKQVNEVKQLLERTHADISDLVHASQARQRTYRKMKHSEEPARVTIRGGDDLLQSLAAALDPDSIGRSRDYVEVAELRQKVAALAGEPTNSLCSAAEEISKQQNEALSSLRTCVQRLNAELFECPEGLEPAMTPPSLGEVMRGVESANTALMEGVNEIASSYAAKTEQIAREGEAGQAARNVFAWFHNDPKRLMEEWRRIEKENQ